MQLIGRDSDAGERAGAVARLCCATDERRVTIDEIQRRVAEHFNIRLSEMTSERRARAVARPRQVAMYLAKQLTTRSLPEIGKKFGGRDHTTVMHAVRKIEELIAQPMRRSPRMSSCCAGCCKAESAAPACRGTVPKAMLGPAPFGAIVCSRLPLPVRDAW